jgi:hypothetical protein
MSYTIVDGIACGNVPLSIFDIVEHLPEFFADLGMLMTCIDSSRDVLSVASASKHQMWKGFEPHGKAVWLPPSAVAWQIENGWSCDGFEEIYLLPRPTSTILLTDEKFTSEGDNLAEAISTEFLKRFRTIQAVRFLSDGCGLNFACEPHFAEAIENLDKYLQDGEPTNSFTVNNSENAPRRAYYLPMTGPANSSLSRSVPRSGEGRKSE